MKKEQLAYRTGRFRDLFIDSFLTVTGISMGSFCIEKLFNIKDFKEFLYLSVYMLPFVSIVKYELNEYKYAFLKYVIKNNILEPNIFDKIDTVKISDEKGLEYLMTKTKKNEFREWATFHHGKVDGNTLTINKILNNDDLKSDNIVTKRYITGVLTKYDPTKYDGHIHYHPSLFGKKFGSINFYISLGDRFGPHLESLNFLCFNTNYGPEIIGFNRIDTFIPQNKNDKSFLVKANKDMILAYLNP